MPVPPTGLLVLEDSLLISLAQNQAATRVIPVLGLLLTLKPAKGCGHCGGGRVPAQQRAATLQSVKQGIAGLPQVKKAELKQLLNARQLRLLFRRVDGKIIQLTF